MILLREKKAIRLPLILIGLFMLIVIIEPYHVVWQLGRYHTIISHKSYNRFSSDRFVIYYGDEIDFVIIEDILRESENSIDFLQELLPFEYDKKIISVIYSNEVEMSKKVPGGRGKGAVGVFTSSSFRILNPDVWLDYPSEFESMVPILHELTHFAVDRITKGNYPLWFTEGVALYMEKRAGKEPWQHYKYYDIKDLEERFDKLDPYTAYGHALRITEKMVKEYGEDVIYSILVELGKGYNFHRSFLNVTGVDFYSFITNIS